MNRRAPADAIRLTEHPFWYVYILKLANGNFYTGYTQDVSERLILKLIQNIREKLSALKIHGY
jgi:predicted GIY-YIG superfamily endonuclease